MSQERQFRLISIILLGFGSAVLINCARLMNPVRDPVEPRHPKAAQVKVSADLEVDAAAEVERINSGEGLPSFQAGEAPLASSGR